MTEPKRLQFETLSSKKEEVTQKQPTTTVRFNLTLVESTDETCPEFSFTELMKNASKKVGTENSKEVHQNGKSDGPTPGPFGDEEDADEIAAIARSFEEKYGPKTDKKKKHKPALDMIVLGEGYDETDDFIDNSEAFDEVIPTTVTTRLGGFYINSGKLEFKELSEDSLQEFQPKPLKKKKKMRIGSDSESDKEQEGIKKKKLIKKRKLKDGVEGEEKKRKKKRLMNGDGEKSFKRPVDKDMKEKALKKKKLSPSVGELLKQQTESTSAPISHQNGSNYNSDIDIHSPSTQEDSSNDGRAMSKVEKTESMISGVSKDDSNSNAEEIKVVDPSTIPKLPANVPVEILQTIENLKEASKHSVEGKCKFFTTNVNSMLLKVELYCRSVPCGQRQNIYGHLASYLPCGKETLVKRAKKLRVSQQDDQLRLPFQQLKDAINEVMPAMQAKHDIECQKVASQRLAENKDKDEQKEGKDESDDSDDEEKGGQDTSGKKRIKGPRKKFEWTDKLRSLLCAVVKIKMSMCEQAKNRTQTAEEFLKSYLEREIKPLWPKGWMQTRMLFKESRSVHSQWTNAPKPKKTVIITKSSASASNTPTLAAAKPVTSGGQADNITETPNRLKDTSNNTATKASSHSLVSNTANSNTMNTSAGSVPVLGASLKSNLSSSSQMSLSSGLSLLAESAASVRASEKSQERSWDHVVSDILKSSLLPSPSKSSTEKSHTPQDSKTKSSGYKESYLSQFQKYASESALAQKLMEVESKEQKGGTRISPQEKTNIVMKKDEPVVKKMQMTAQSKGDKHPSPSMVQSNAQLSKAMASPTSANPLYQQQALASSIAAAQSQLKAAAGMSASANAQLTGLQRSLLNEDVYRHLLETSVTKLSKPSTKTTSGATYTQKQSIPVSTSASKSVQPNTKVTLTKVIPVGPGAPNWDKNRTSGVASKSPVTQGNPKVTVVQVSRASPSSTVASRPHGYDRSVTQVSPQSRTVNKETVSLNNQSQNSVSATNLLQSLFGQMQERDGRTGTSPMTISPTSQKQVKTPSGNVRPANPQSKSPQSHQVWSMNSIAFTSNSVQSSGGHPQNTYSPSASGTAKSLPGFQGVHIPKLRHDQPHLPHQDPKQSLRGMPGYPNVSPTHNFQQKQQQKQHQQQQQQQQQSPHAGQRTSPQQMADKQRSSHGY